MTSIIENACRATHSSSERKGRRPPTVDDGFTLIELLIVLALASIMVVVAAPSFDLGRYQAEAAMQTVGSRLLSAQRLAITRQHDVIVQFDTANLVLRVIEDANGDGDFDTGERATAHSIGDGAVFGRGNAVANPVGTQTVTFSETTGGLPSVTFHRDGSASEAGGVYIQAARAEAAGRTEGTRLLTIDRATGRPSWFRYTHDGEWKRGF